MMSKKFFAGLVIFSLVAAIVGNPIVSSNTISTSNTVKADYNYGASLGRDYEDLYRTTATNFWSEINERSWDKNTLIKSAEEHIIILKEYYPQQLERLRGLADTLNMPLEEVVAISMYLPAIIDLGCTNTAVVPPATNDGQRYTSWNMDVLDPLMLVGAPMVVPIPVNLLFFVEETPGNNKCVIFGIPLIFGIGLMNDKGLTYVGNAVGLKDGNDKGLTDFELNKLCMETCSSVDDVIDVYKKTPKYSCPGYSAGIFLNMNTMWTDASDNIATIEHSGHHTYILTTAPVKEMEKNIDGSTLVVKRTDYYAMAETNHHQYLDRTLSGSPTPHDQKAIAGSYARLGRAWELLNENYGKIDLEFIKKFTADTGRNYTLLEEFGDYTVDKPVDDDTICCKYWNLPGYIKNLQFQEAFDCFAAGTTLFTMIIQPDDFIIYVYPGRSDNMPCIPLYFAPLLKVDGPAYAGGMEDMVSCIGNGLLQSTNTCSSCLLAMPGAPEICSPMFPGIVNLLKVVVPILDKLIPVG